MKHWKHWTAKELLKKGVPAVLIPGFIVAMLLGWKGDILQKARNYYSIKQVFPSHGIVAIVEDGDTFRLKNGVTVRLIGINAPGRGQIGYEESKKALGTLTAGKTVYLEYDRYMDDKYGRVLAWVWVDCEKTPTLSPADYMRLSYNTSRPGLTSNPDGCRNGTLINEELVKEKLAVIETYKERGELKYEGRLRGLAAQAESAVK